MCFYFLFLAIRDSLIIGCFNMLELFHWGRFCLNTSKAFFFPYVYFSTSFHYVQGRWHGNVRFTFCLVFYESRATIFYEIHNSLDTFFLFEK